MVIDLRAQPTDVCVWPPVNDNNTITKTKLCDIHKTLEDMIEDPLGKIDQVA